MGVQPFKRIFGDGARGFAIETVVLWVALSAPAMLLHSRLGALITGGIALLYVYLGARGKRIGGAPAPTALHAILQTVAMWLVIMALTVPPVMAWLLWAFPGLGRHIGGPAYLPSAAGALGLMIGLLIGSLAIAGASALLLRRNNEPIGAVGRRFLADAARGYEPTVAAVAVAFAVIGLMTMAAAAVSFGLLIDTLTPHRTLPLAWEVTVAAPALPMGFLASAVLLVIFRRLLRSSSAADERQDAAPVMARSGRIAAGVATLASGAMVVGTIGYFLHVGLFAAFGVVASIEPAYTVADGIDDWVAEQQEAGRSGGEIAALLDEHGQWTPGSPESGLGVLMPMLKDEKSSGETEAAACRFTIEAAAADPDALRDIDWLPAADAARPVRYCLAVACPGPTRWPDDVTLSLFSSHASRNRYWTENRFLDVFAHGATEPGGYCMTDGSLAERFQG